MIKTIEDLNKSMHRSCKLSAISFADSVRYKSGVIRFINCICECGNSVVVRLSYIISGVTVSCGCKKTADTITRNTKYIGSNKKINNIYHAMMGRCYNVKRRGYENYGGKGVIVCEEWRNSYQSFLDWCLNNGWRIGLDLDKDTKGNGFIYSPETCCFLPASINRALQPKHKHKKKIGLCVVRCPERAA